MLINVKTNEELLKAEEEKRKETEGKTTPDIGSLANYVRGLWDKAYRSKSEIQDKMLKSLQRYEGKYSAEHLAAIKQLNSSEIFIPITNIKCRASEAWIKEVLLQPGEIPWDLEPSPVPEVSETTQQEVMNTIMPAFTEIISNHVAQQSTTGVPINQGQMINEMKKYTKEIKEFYDNKLIEEAKELADEVKQKINDIFTEGGFYQALEACLHDINIFPTAILKGPVYRKEKKAKFTPEGITFEDKIIEQYERRNPLDIYPAPESGGVDDSYLFDKISITPKQLSELKGVSGFNSFEIDMVLSEVGMGGLREWTTFDTIRLQTENKTPIATSDSDRIDALEFWGTVQGKYLIEWGMKESGLEESKYYDVCVWLIGTHVIKAMLNPNPMGKKPYSRASFVEIPDSFWGISVSDIIEPIQTGCNAVGRAIINNAAIASGPLIERNIDRVPSYESKTIYPWKMFDSTDMTMSSTSPAYRFYQPPNVADRLLIVFEAFMKQADELSGIPAYAHGDVTVGGAGRTATGLEMLTNNANRGIKAVMRNIDKGLIEPTVTRQYYAYLKDNPGVEVPDLSIVAKGSIALMEKELMSVRRNEFLTIAMNPILAQILGVEGLKYLTEEVAKAHGIDTDKLFPLQMPVPGGTNMMEQMLAGAGGGGMAPPPGPENYTASGAGAGGTDVNNFQSENGR